MPLITSVILSVATLSAATNPKRVVSPVIVQSIVSSVLLSCAWDTSMCLYGQEVALTIVFRFGFVVREFGHPPCGDDRLAQSVRCGVCGLGEAKFTLHSATRCDCAAPRIPRTTS